MKVKKEYLYPAALIVLLSAYLIFRSGDRTHYSLPETVKLQKDEITKMVFSSGDDTVVLERQNETWRIRPDGFTADNSAVDRMLDAVTGFSLTTLVAESGNYAPYDLEGAKRVKLEVYSGEKVALAVDIGKTASTYRHTYVKLEGKDEVYQASGNMRSVFETDLDKLRDKTAVSFDREAPVSLDIISMDGVVSLLKTSILPETSVADSTAAKDARSGWLAADGKEADEKAIDQILSALSNLKCERYVEGKTKDDFQQPLYTITVRVPDAVTLSIFGLEGENYTAVSSMNEFPFYIPKWRAEQIMKKPDDLFPKVEDK